MKPKPKRKHKKKGDHWGTEKGKAKNPWDIDIDTSDEPKVAFGTQLPKVRSEPRASEARKMRSKG
jgi:hypothetical protein